MREQSESELWDAYEQELEEFGSEDVSLVASPEALGSLQASAKGGDAVLVGAAEANFLGRLVMGGVSVLGAVGLWSGAARAPERASLMGRITREDASDPLAGARLLRRAAFDAKAWRSLAKLESALDGEDDYSSLTLRLITLTEAAVRGLLWKESEDIFEMVLDGASKRDARFLRKVAEHGRGMTLLSTAVWVSELERAVAENHDPVIQHLSQRVALPRIVVVDARMGRTLKTLNQTRNALAHATGESTGETQHRDVCGRLLGVASVANWWADGAAQDTAMSLLLVGRAALVEAAGGIDH